LAAAGGAIAEICISPDNHAILAKTGKTEVDTIFRDTSINLSLESTTKSKKWAFVIGISSQEDGRSEEIHYVISASQRKLLSDSELGLNPPSSVLSLDNDSKITALSSGNEVSIILDSLPPNH